MAPTPPRARVAPDALAAAARRRSGVPSCYVKGCLSGAPYTPVLHMALLGTERISRVTLPVHLCSTHRNAFRRTILSAERRSQMEGSLRSRGKALPDWSRTTVEFVAP